MTKAKAPDIPKVFIVRILLPCVAAYLDQALRRVSLGLFTERSFVRLLEETLAVVTSDHARFVSRMERLDFIRCFPPSLRTANLPKIQRFVRYRLSPPRST